MFHWEFTGVTYRLYSVIPCQQSSTEVGFIIKDKKSGRWMIWSNGQTWDNVGTKGFANAKRILISWLLRAGANYNQQKSDMKRA